MFENTVKAVEKKEDKQKIIAALNCVCAGRPYLSGLAMKLKIFISYSLDTAGITQSGRLMINPQFMNELNLQEFSFILAHELMHLVLKTHDRQLGFSDSNLVNIAHDFIINDDLMDDFACTYLEWDDYYDGYCNKEAPPAGGLNWRDYSNRVPDWKSAREYSLEEFVRILKELNIFPDRAWKTSMERSRVYTSHNNSSSSNSSDLPLTGGGNSGGGMLGDILAAAGIGNSESSEKTNKKGNKTSKTGKINQIKILTDSYWDVLTTDEEQQLFPDLTAQAIAIDQKEIRDVAVRAYTEAVLKEALEKNEQLKFRGTEAGNGYGMIQLLRGSYATPWEAALQRWFDASTPGDRSFARASRRGAWRTDVVLPGRKREGWTIHIVLDTSGSMSGSLRHALGAIDQFCQNNNVETVHILQCDTGVTADEWLEVGNLENFQAKGFGGSDMSPGMLALAEDPDVTAVIVLTDGYICYPSQQPPYDVLWCIVDGGNTDFNYGTAVRITAQ